MFLELSIVLKTKFLDFPEKSKHTKEIYSNHLLDNQDNLMIKQHWLIRCRKRIDGKIEKLFGYIHKEPSKTPSKKKP